MNADAVAVDDRLQVVVVQLRRQVVDTVTHKHLIAVVPFQHFQFVDVLTHLQLQGLGVFRVHAPAVLAAKRRPGVGADHFPGLALFQHEAGGQHQGLVGVEPGFREQQFAMVLDKAGGQIRFPERLGVGQGVEETDVSFHAGDAVVLQSLHHTVDGLVPGFVPHDELGDHRVVVDADVVAFGDASIHPHVGAFIGRAQVAQVAGGGQEILVRVFGVNTCFQGVAPGFHLGLFQRQRIAPGDFQLPFHQVLAGDHFGDRVLYLQAGVHFHKEEGAVHVVEEFHGAGADVVDGLGGFDGRFAHGFAGVFAQARGGGFFQHFLVAALNRTVALGQVDAFAALVTEHLNLHVAWLGQVAFDEHVRVAEGVLRFPLGGGQGIVEVFHSLDHAHAFATTAGDGFQQQWEAALLGFLAQGVRSLVVTVVTRHQGHAGFFHNGLGGGLGTHGRDGGGGRADEHDVVGFAGFGELGVLGEEPVARVNGLGAAFFRHLDDLVGFEVALGAGCRADVEGFVSHGDMARVGVGVRVDSDNANAHAVGGLYDPAGDFAPVGDQDFAEHGYSSSGTQLALRLFRKAPSPSCPSAPTRMSAMRCAVSSITSALIGLWLTANTRSFAAFMASGPLMASCCSISLQRAFMASTSSQTMCTRPYSCACVAENTSADRK